MMDKPNKPTDDFPLFPHASRQWAKKVGGKLHYFGPWSDPDAALKRYLAWKNGKSTRPKHPRLSHREKPSKPYPDYPLYAHALGQWAKRIRNKTHYFGPWDDPDAALEKYLAEKDDLLAGRVPNSGEGLNLKELVNRFLNSKLLKVQAGELKQRTWDDYKVVTDRLIDYFGASQSVSKLRAADFERLRAELAKTHGPVSLANDVTRIRVVLKFAYDHDLIERPIRYGPSFSKPSRAVLRRARHEKGPRLFKPKQLRAMIGAASKQLRAMILLGINCGFGNTDCATLPVSALDLRHGWVSFPRPKTGIPRRCRLWPETVEALKEVLADRPPRSRLVFATSKGNTWERTKNDNPISKETAKLLRKLKLNRPGLTFYALRHTFQTIGEESGDETAVRFIMGHVPPTSDMSSVYRERITAKRLHAVAVHVRQWLFSGRKDKNQSAPAAASESET